MQEEYLLSIIIPVYNAEKYLETCLNSIVAHISDYKVQVIAVDDGSTDNSANILQKYKAKYGITVVSQNNTGVSSARNAGIEEAKGKYLTFVDSDDIVLESFWNDIYTYKDSQNEMIIYDYVDVDRRDNVIQEVNVTENINDINDVKKSFLVDHLFNTCWGKVYLTKIVKDNHILFPVGMSMGEDMLWMAQLIDAIQAIGCVNCYAYGYRQNGNGAMVQLRKALTPERVDELVKGIERKSQIGQSMNWTKELREEFYQNYANKSVARINFAIKSSDDFCNLNNQINSFLENSTIHELFSNTINSKSINKKRRIICLILQHKISRRVYIRIKYMLYK